MVISSRSVREFSIATFSFSATSLIICITIVFNTLSNNNNEGPIGKPIVERDYYKYNITDEQAQCIADRTTFMGTEWCTFCKKQKENIGVWLTSETFIDCDIDKTTCFDTHNVKGYPTTVVVGPSDIIRLTGPQTVDTLLKASGCNN